MSYLSRLVSLRNLSCLKKNSDTIIRTYVLKPSGLKTNTSKCNLNQTRHRSFFRFFRKETPEGYRIKDNIPQSYTLIYRNTMDKYILTAQIVSAGFMAFLAVVVVYLSSAEDNPQVNFDTWQKKPRAVENELFVYLTALAAFCVCMQFLVVRSPLRVYSNGKAQKYIFINYGLVPFQKNVLACSRKEISKLPDSGLIPWNSSWFDVKNNPMILVENFFRMPADMYVMLGEQEYYDD